MWSAIPFAYKLIGIVTLVLAVMGWWQWHNIQQRSLGAQKLQNELKANDTQSLKDKVKNDAELGSKSDDDLIGEFQPDSVQ